MSGGKYDYAYAKVESFIYEFASKANTVQRKSFLKLLVNVQEAMRAIEWVDSGDGADEDAAIQKCFMLWGDTQIDVLKAECDELVKMIENAKADLVKERTK